MGEKSNRKPIRVLLIEGSDTDATFVTRLLKSNPQLPFEVDRASLLSDALEILAKQEFDVTVLDLCLPDAHELESFQQIRALDARIPIVVFTGIDDEELALRAIESGAQDFMAKGHVTGQMLFRAVRFAIARQRKVMGFKAAADSDPLTGMPNRRHLETQFTELVTECRAKELPMSLALLDVDHFKRINDRYGHFIGDAVLKEIAAVLTDSLKDNMLAARFGGEEFALLMPGCNLRQACQVMDQTLRRIAGSPMLFDDVTITVTASAGLVEVDPEDTWDTCYVTCDVALYEAKTSGRNRLVSRQSDPALTNA
jgi:two-component system cell cycle response regulator